MCSNFASSWIVCYNIEKQGSCSGHSSYWGPISLHVIIFWESSRAYTICFFRRAQGHPIGDSPYFGPSVKLDFELEMVTKHSFLLNLIVDFDLCSILDVCILLLWNSLHFSIFPSISPAIWYCIAYRLQCLVRVHLAYCLYT